MPWVAGGGTIPAGTASLRRRSVSGPTKARTRAPADSAHATVGIVTFIARAAVLLFVDAHPNARTVPAHDSRCWARLFPAQPPGQCGRLTSLRKVAVAAS